MNRQLPGKQISNKQVKNSTRGLETAAEIDLQDVV